MEVICSPAGIVEADRPGQGILDIVRAGFSKTVLDLTQYCREDVLENLGEQKVSSHMTAKIAEAPGKLGEYVRPFFEKCKQENLSCAVAVAPYLLRNTKRSDLNELLAGLAEESIRVCGSTGCRYLVVRPLAAGIAASDIWEVNRKFYLRLAPLAKEHHVVILLENQCKDKNGHLVRGICSDGRMAAQWVDCLNEEAGEERFGFCMDAGVCNLCGQNMYEFICALGKRLCAVVVRDCDGVKENAMLPFTCVNKGGSQTDWLNLIRGLRENGFDGQLILDFEDTARAFSPILRPGLMQLSRAVADYLKWQIELESLLKKYPSRVLFGAGNMCRNYMKCYGAQYPPIYTCDNNKNLWETEFCGLEVKNPEALRELPEECAIFICNIYYREIEQQLRGMGLKNPIEFFNDEYMPDFYFDRLKDRGRK